MHSIPLMVAIAATSVPTINDLTPVTDLRVPDICSEVLHELIDAVAEEIISPIDAHKIYMTCTEVSEV